MDNYKRDDQKLIRLLRTAGGQIEGIVKMLEDKKYCIDISNQIMACQAILAKVNKEVLNAHLRSCVAHSVMEGNSDEKMDELSKVLDKLVK